MKRRKAIRGTSNYSETSKAKSESKVETSVPKEEPVKKETIVAPKPAPTVSTGFKSSSAMDRLRKERGQDVEIDDHKYVRHELQFKDPYEDEMRSFTTSKIVFDSTNEAQLQFVQSALKDADQKEEPIPITPENTKLKRKSRVQKKEEKKEKVTEKKKEIEKKEDQETKPEPKKEEAPKPVKKKKISERKQRKKEKEQAERKKRLEKTTKKRLNKKKGGFFKKKSKEDKKDSMSIEEMDKIFPVEVEEKPVERIGFRRKKKDVEQKAKEPMSFQKKMVFRIVGTLLFLLLGYSYVVLIRNPQNNPSQDQIETYNKLVEYADEWDMLSETEKNELLEIEKKYDGLLSKQKSAINDYFKEQTNQSLKDIYEDLNAKQAEEADETSASYRVLSEYLANWEDHTENMRTAIITYKGLYDSLSPSLQEKINDKTKELTGLSFNTLYRQYNEGSVAEVGSIPSMYPQYRQKLRNDYQSELDELQAKYQELSTRETSLQKQKEKLSPNSKKYEPLMQEIEYNEVNLGQVQLLIEYYSQIIEQYDTLPSTVVIGY